MAGTFQFGTPSLESFSVLLIMGGLSLVFSLSFYLKSRAVRKLPKTLTAEVFDRTFNVFNPFSQAKRTYHSYLFFLIFSPLVAFTWTFILVFVVFLQVLEAGLLLGLILFILSLGFMMTDEAYEMHQNASILEKAVKNGAHLGRGDIAVLSLVKKTLWKLSVYYLFLSLVFLGSFFVMPQVFPQLFSAFVYFIGIIGSTSVLTNILAPIVTSFLIALSTVAIFLIARRVKSKIFGFPPPGSLTSVGSATVRYKIAYENQTQILESDPDELTW